MSHFDYNPRAVLAADPATLQGVVGVGPKIAESIKQIDIAQVEQNIFHWQQQGISIITTRDFAYPPRLNELDDPPPTLFVRGDWRRQFLEKKACAIVGTREPSKQASKTARKLALELACCGYAIVSGLAAGIDTEAHKGALDCLGGYTFAVLGSGVLNIYPEENANLADFIADRGALLSEVYPDAYVHRASLIPRNRIISGLSDSLIVIETETDGGAMHAARFAREQGRRIYAVDCSASGNRALLREGATPISPDLRDLEF